MMVKKHNNKYQSNSLPQEKNKLAWVNIGDREFSLSDDFNNEIIISPFNGEKTFIALMYTKDGSVYIIAPEPKSFGDCKKICEIFAQQNLSIEYAYTDGPWMQMAQNMPPTPSQIVLLGKNCRFKNGMNKAKASLEIRKIIALNRKTWRMHRSSVAMQEEHPS